MNCHFLPRKLPHNRLLCATSFLEVKRGHNEQVIYLNPRLSDE